jgi:hypothetical protein
LERKLLEETNGVLKKRLGRLFWRGGGKIFGNIVRSEGVL